MEFIWMGILLGLTGSLHCVGMCGPIALALPLNRSSILTKTFGIFAYNLGRMVTYSLFGILFGFFGKGLQLAGILQLVSILLGVLIVLSVLTPVLMKKISFTNKYYLQLNSWINQKIRGRFSSSSNKSLLLLGMLNGLLPCGMVFFALSTALAQGSIEGSLGIMFFFGLGTVPMMFVIPYYSTFISAVVKKKMTKVIPYIMILFGILIILRGMNLGIPYLSPEFNETRTEVKKCCH